MKSALLIASAVVLAAFAPALIAVAGAGQDHEGVRRPVAGDESSPARPAA